MWQKERENLILSQLAASGRVAIADLVRATGVSRETLRGDLETLASAGELVRVRGGAVIAVPTDMPEPAFDERMNHQAQAKLAIGQAAAAALPRNSSLFIDAGSTTAAFARALLERPDLKVTTNSVNVARTLAGRKDVLLLGGAPDIAGQGLYGELTLSQLRRFRADIAVISPVAVDPRRGISDYELHEAEVATAMCEASERRMVLAQAEKIDARSRVMIARIQDIEWLVTDAIDGCSEWPASLQLVTARLP